MLKTNFSNGGRGIFACGLFAAVLAMPSIAMTDAETKALAKKSQNPVAKMISVPFEYNFNGEFGPNNGKQHVLNIKPVLPVAIGENWNLIHRAIIPLVSQPGIPGGPNRQNGLGDTTYQGFFSPSNPGKVIWGAGPSVQVPTHTDEVLGNENWAAGPVAVLLSMPGRWVIGGLISQIWDFAGSSNDGSDADISLLVAQPFANYNFDGGWYLNTSPVITANWEADKSSDEWTIPVGGGVGRVFHWGKQAINARMAYYYNVEKPEFGAQWDFQLTVNFLFPK
jgi:hypothetical protein